MLYVSLAPSAKSLVSPTQTYFVSVNAFPDNVRLYSTKNFPPVKFRPMCVIMTEMKREKPLTGSEMLVVLKEAGVATKNDVRRIVGEELTGRGVATKDDVRATETKLEAKMGKMERSLKRRIGEERNKILRSLANLATHSPTLKDFDALKQRVDHYLSVT